MVGNTGLELREIWEGEMGVLSFVISLGNETEHELSATFFGLNPPLLDVM